ncbi:MAG: CDC27 family protein [Sulfuricurvum sp.]|nr:CDC27 family protein [Sulfuricurvum sp.]MDP3291074.1 CDC27 family protein [Sulfuricurvum sp.]
MDFVQSFQTTIPETQIATAPAPQRALPPQQSIPVPKVLNIPSSTSIKAPPPAISPLSGDKSLSLNRNESKLDIESVERRFKETSNPNLGLFIARYHYDHGNYSEAYNFSLKTNSMNSKIDESWIIFAKSLVKLGRVEQAKKTLHLYISESNSESARSLLDSIEQGTFK